MLSSLGGAVDALVDGGDKSSAGLGPSPPPTAGGGAAAAGVKGTWLSVGAADRPRIGMRVVDLPPTPLEFEPVAPLDVVAAAELAVAAPVVAPLARCLRSMTQRCSVWMALQ